MKNEIDLFSRQAKAYKKYRPLYPEEFYHEILALTEHRNCCWDCGTGNGQVAQFMANHFNQVYATDISENQLKEAERTPNIVYRKERAEATSFKNNVFDFIAVAQAVHWFDFEAFYEEVRRTAKDNAVIAIWGYGLLQIEGPLDEIISAFYHKTVGPYWNEERKHIDSQYETIGFPFKEIKLSKPYQIEQEMNLSQLKGFFNSWSSVQHYIASERKNPVDGLIGEMSKHWEDPKIVKNIRYPMFAKIGTVSK